MLVLRGKRPIIAFERREQLNIFHAGVPEKVIQERTGHLSLSGLRQNERTSSDQQLAVSKVLSSCENTMYQQQLLPAEQPAQPDQQLAVSKIQSSCENTM